MSRGRPAADRPRRPPGPRAAERRAPPLSPGRARRWPSPRAWTQGSCRADGRQSVLRDRGARRRAPGAPRDRPRRRAGPRRAPRRRRRGRSSTRPRSCRGGSSAGCRGARPAEDGLHECLSAGVLVEVPARSRSGTSWPGWRSRRPSPGPSGGLHAGCSRRWSIRARARPTRRAWPTTPMRRRRRRSPPPCAGGRRARRGGSAPTARRPTSTRGALRAGGGLTPSAGRALEG